MQELSSLFKVMHERGNGAAIDRPFSSPYYWAGFQVRLSLDRGTGNEKRSGRSAKLFAAGRSERLSS